MRISDWSSDLCSSDLHSVTGSGGDSLDIQVDAVVDGSQVTQTVAAAGDENTTIYLNLAIDLGGDSTSVVTDPDTDQPATQGGADKDGTESIDEVVVTLTEGELGWAALPASIGAPVQDPAGTWTFRSEEHTSELQSLMCISYAVFSSDKQPKRST